MPDAMANVLTALRVLEGVSDHQPVGVSELSRVLGVPKTTVQRALDTLLVGGWLNRSNDGVWTLSLRLAVVGRRAGQHRAVRELARPVMLQLSRATDEAVRLWMPQGHNVVLVESFDSNQAVRSVHPSTFSGTLPMHASAAGKAILALLPAAEVDALLTPPLRVLTPATITDPDEVRQLFPVIRKKGYAEAHNETADDVGDIAAAVTVDGRPVAAIALNVPNHRLTKRLTASYGQLLVDAVSQISR
jgi:IclR family transcriptional regulator, acetate operon repressor